MFTLIHASHFLVSLPNTISVHLAVISVLFSWLHREMCLGVRSSCLPLLYPPSLPSRQAHTASLSGRSSWTSHARLTGLGLLGGWVRAVCEMTAQRPNYRKTALCFGSKEEPWRQETQRFLHLLSRWEDISDSKDNLLKMVGSVRADLSGQRGFSH